MKIKPSFKPFMLILISITMIFNFAILFNSITPFISIKTDYNYENEIQVKSSGIEFELTEEFKPTTYFLSPESSPNIKDEVYFSFKANRNGNYTINIENFPSFITDNANMENHLTFDNPSGTNLWYLLYTEMDTMSIGKFYIKMLLSQDKGISWTSTTISTLYCESDNIMDILQFITGSSIAVNPSTGLICVATWIEKTNLTLFKSLDNGTTWEEPFTIYNSTQIGNDVIMSDWQEHPKIEIALKKNGTICILSETDDRHIAYIESNNNGTIWSNPQNITWLEGTKVTKPKIQVDQNSGKFWLMWKLTFDGTNNQTLQWAEFQDNDNPLNSPVGGPKNVSDELHDCFDFYYDENNDRFRILQIRWTGFDTEVINWTCDSYSSNSWSSTSLITNNELFEKLYSDKSYTNFLFVDDLYHFFYVYDYLGKDDIYHYRHFTNSTLWQDSDSFNKDKLTQVGWNGRKNDNSSIETTLIRVLFECQNSSTPFSNPTRRNFTLLIDNYDPSIVKCDQDRQYFNPLSSESSITKVNWDLRSSELCEALLKIYSENISSSSWSRVGDNNVEDTKPKIAISNNNILYLMYQTTEVGRYIINFRRSIDMGVSWTDPIRIHEIFGNEVESISLDAWGDIVCLYIEEENNNKRFLYRSFDQGDNFQEAIQLTSIINSQHPTLLDSHIVKITDILFTNNGSLYLSFSKEVYTDNSSYYILRSDNLGLNWSISTTFENFLDREPDDSDMVYDSVNDLIYIKMGISLTKPVSFEKNTNFSISTYNSSSQTWSTPVEINNITTNPFSSEPGKLLITRDNKTTYPIVRLVYLYDYIFGDIPVSINKEIISTDFGKNWNSPINSSINKNSDICSNLDNIYYIISQSDGYDSELYFKREGRLTRIDQVSVNSVIGSEFIFDGIDDFGDMVSSGNYTFEIIFSDRGGNFVSKEGWFYMDSQSPTVSEKLLVPTIPNPTGGILFVANADDNLISREDLSVYVCYQFSNNTVTHPWQEQKLSYVPPGNDHHAYQITGNYTTTRIQYYYKVVDSAGNIGIDDNNGSRYEYHVPDFDFSATESSLLNPIDSYSSGEDYQISLLITEDNNYVNVVYFRYSIDEGNTWVDLELTANSPTYTGVLSSELIPGDLRSFLYQIVILDVHNLESILINTQQISFYPEMPIITLGGSEYMMILLSSALIGAVVALGYVKLKQTSHQVMKKQLILSRLTGIKDSSATVKKSKLRLRKSKDDETGLPSKLGDSSLSLVYSGTLVVMFVVFIIGIIVSFIEAQFGLLVLIGSLLIGVFGYMILMSKDITSNLFLEKIVPLNFLNEIFQIGFLFVNIVVILLFGSTIPWFNYYLIESTFDFGSISIPRLYISVLGVFFTSLALVLITTFIQLRKAVKSIQDQRKEGATDNILIYTKDQNISRLITQMGYKTTLFLVSVLVAVITTTNLLTPETAILLLIITGPFVVSCLLILRLHSRHRKRLESKGSVDKDLPFVESKKICSNCGEDVFLNDKFCSSCSEQLIFPVKMGMYQSRCTKCNALVYLNAKFCTKCGTKAPIDKG